MKARGNTKIMLEKVGEIQNLIGEAKGLHTDDRDPQGFAIAQKKLGQAFELCLQIRSKYDPI